MSGSHLIQAWPSSPSLEGSGDERSEMHKLCQNLRRRKRSVANPCNQWTCDNQPDSRKGLAYDVNPHQHGERRERSSPFLRGTPSRRLNPSQKGCGWDIAAAAAATRRPRPCQAFWELQALERLPVPIERRRKPSAATMAERRFPSRERKAGHRSAARIGRPAAIVRRDGADSLGNIRATHKIPDGPPPARVRRWPATLPLASG